MDKIDFRNLVKKVLTNCPCCERVAKSVIDLPNYPLTEFYKNIDNQAQRYGFIDQEVLFCDRCNHLFLKKILDAQKIYSNYLTSTISSSGAVICLQNFADFIRGTMSDVSQYSLIDIGGNDSTFLQFFDGKISNLINIDANASAENEKIKLYKSFVEDFDFDEFKTIGKKIYASSHTLEHLENPVLFIENLAKTINTNDVLYMQFPSLELLIQQRRFDQLCHQHLNYFSLASICETLNRFGLYINKYEFDSSHFGTLRLKASRTSTSNQDICEKRTAHDVSAAYANFSQYYRALNSILEEPFEGGQGFGAALMVPTLAYHLPLINSLNKIIDQNPSRINKRFINLDPPILPMTELELHKPVLVTAISTKAATRSIFQKLSTLGVADICIPSVVI